MSEISNTADAGRCCLVTVGATSSFTDLIRAVLDEAFLKKLGSLGYSSLLIQHGKDGEATVTQSLGLGAVNSEQLGKFHGVLIVGFDFRNEGLTKEMTIAKGHSGREGVVISHAGSGSILEAMRVNVPLIVVPNSSLLHNHQEELAEELAHQGYVVHGKLDDLGSALDEVETLRRNKKAWPPHQHELDPAGKGLVGALDDEMGFVD